MRAIVYEGPGRLELKTVTDPVPGPGELLLDVGALGICGSDLLLRDGGLHRVTPPVVVGHEFSGTVTVAGPGTATPIGTRVAVRPLISCGECRSCTAGSPHICETLGLYGIDVDGAAAERVVVPESSVHAIPDSMTLRLAALVEPTAVACHMVRRAGVAAGSVVFVVGGGPIGALVALVAKARGAIMVRVSEPNPDRRAVLADLGLDVVDPRGRSTSDLLAGFPCAPDVVMELTGLAVGLTTALDAAAPGAVVLLGGLPHGPVEVATTLAVFKELTLVGARVYEPADVDAAIGLLDSGAVPGLQLITRVVSLDHAIDDAYDRLAVSPHDMKIIIEPNGEQR